MFLAEPSPLFWALFPVLTGLTGDFWEPLRHIPTPGSQHPPKPQNIPSWKGPAGSRIQRFSSHNNSSPPLRALFKHCWGSGSLRGGDLTMHNWDKHHKAQLETGNFSLGPLGTKPESPQVSAGHWSCFPSPFWFKENFTCTKSTQKCLKNCKEDELLPLSFRF